MNGAATGLKFSGEDARVDRKILVYIKAPSAGGLLMKMQTLIYARIV